MYRMFNEKSFNENFSLREIYKNNNSKKKRKKKRKYYDFAHAHAIAHLSGNSIKETAFLQSYLIIASYFAF